MKYAYEARFRRATTVLAMLVLLLNLSEYILAWIRTLYTLIYKPLQLPYLEFFQLFQAVLPTLLTAHLGLLFALIAARAIAFLTPRITIRSNGLLMSTMLGQRWVPFGALRGIRSTELPNQRYVVWVDSSQGLPLHNWWGSLLFGRWLWRGFILTSDLAGFDDVISTIITQLKNKYGEEKFAAHFVEEQPTWLLAMLNAPRATVRQVVQAESLPIDQRQAMMQMISVSLALAIPAIVSGIIHLKMPFIVFLVPLVALIEFPLVSMYLTAIPITSTQRMEFEDAMRVYPLTQLPRWWIALGLTLLIIAGVPAQILFLVPVIAIALGCLPVLTLTEEWFHVQPPESWMGILCTAIFQLMVYELLIVFLPR
jgi:hypothetical protein